MRKLLTKLRSALRPWAPVLLIAPLAACGDGDVKVAWWGDLLIVLAGSAGTALLGLAGRALDKLTQTWAEKSKLGFIARLDELTLGIVQDIYSQEVEHLKAAASDGKLTKAERQEMKRIAVDRLKATFSLAELGKVFGGSIQQGLESTVEKAVSKSKALGNLTKAAANP